MFLLIGILAIAAAALLISPPALDALWSALARRGRMGGGARNTAFNERLMSGAIVIAITGVILVVVGLVQGG
jgi:hypothetical protein